MGMAPASLFVKNIDASEGWSTLNAQDPGYNVNNQRMYYNSTNAVSSGTFMDFVSNGIKLRIADNPNASGTWIYGAWGGRPIQGPAPASNTNQGRAR
jgi:hypothetical protein